jgi:hypothetical protein
MLKGVKENKINVKIKGCITQTDLQKNLMLNNPVMTLCLQI